MSIFFPTKLNSIFFMATNLGVVAICGRGREDSFPSKLVGR